jgi:hypothetical protein
VTDCCTGNPTSTFGGGGGTKLFCSQPVSATNAAMAKHRRQAFVAACLAATSDLLHAGDRVGFIPVPQSVLSQKVFYSEQRAFGYPMKMAQTIYLQWYSKEKMISPAKVFLSTFFRRFHFD